MTLRRLLCLLLVCSGWLRSACGQTFRTAQRVPLPVDPYGLTTGDVNGDGRTDVVWVELPGYPGTAYLHVLLATGNGIYNAGVTVGLPTPPTSMQCVVEDVTGDHRNDLVCVAVVNSYTATELWTFPGNGDGTFGTVVRTRLNTQVVFTSPLLAATGDLNGDGLPDLLVMNAYYNGIYPYLSDGRGGFTQGVQFEGSFNFAIPTVADVNGDGKLDVVWPQGPRVNLGRGDGSFGPIAQYDPGYLSNCALGDVDHDGHLDAACTWFDSGDLDGRIHLTVLHGNADGSFNPTPLFSRVFGDQDGEDDGSVTITQPVLIADLNGDGNADIVSLSGDGYCVLLGGAGVTWNGAPRQFGAASSDMRFAASIYPIYGSSFGDLDGDGLVDVAGVGPNGVYLIYGQVDGTLSSAPAYEAGEVSTSIALLDANGDGNLDMVSVGDTALKLSLGRGDGTFAAPVAVTTVDDFNQDRATHPQVISGDFDGDGKADVLATGSTAQYQSQTYVLMGHGDGTFGTPVATTAVMGTVADLNGDGRSDVAAIQNSGLTASQLQVSLSRGDGSFTTVATSLPVVLGGGFPEGFAGPALADFRHTGRMDAAVANVSYAYLVRSLGDGTFDASAAGMAIPGVAGLNEVAVEGVAAGDFDADGNQDMAVLVEYGSGLYSTGTPTSVVWVYYGGGDGTFSAAVEAGQFNRDAQAMQVGDLDGDGRADVVVTSFSVYQTTGAMAVRSQANRGWGAEEDYAPGQASSPIWVADINHDGKNDLLFAGGANSLSVLLQGAASTVSPLLTPVATLTSTPVSAPVGTAVTLTAVVSGSGAVPTGTVVFSVDGVAQTAATLAGGTASLGLGSLSAGSHAATCTYSGDAVYAGAACNAVTITMTTVAAPTVLTLTAAPNPAYALSPVSFVSTLRSGTAAEAAGQTLTFAVDGASAGAAATNAAGQASVGSAGLTTGTHTVTVSFAGTSSLEGASASVVEQVNANPTATVLAASPNPVNQGAALLLSVGVSSATTAVPPAGMVTLYDGGVALGGVPLTAGSGSLGTATLTVTTLSAGQHTLVAVFAPTGTAFLGSTSAAVGVTVNPSALTISTTPQTVTLETGHHTSVTVNLSSVGLLAGTYRVTCGGFPALVSCLWPGGNTAVLTAGGTASMTLAIDTDAVLSYESYQGQQAGWGGWRTGMGLLAGMFGLGLGRRRRRRVWMMAALGAVVLVSGVTACSGRYPASTPVGTYSLPLTVESVSGTAVNQTATLQLVVTP